MELRVPHRLPPQQFARQAGLKYVRDCTPGLTRKRWGRGFTYLDEQGDRITDPIECDRLKTLNIPPAWTEVWICPSPNGHLIATGRDAKGRKQYLYHPDWQRIRSQTKFNRMLAFGQKLPRLRQRIKQDMAQQRLNQSKVIATVVKLLETTLIRVGNETYAQQNQSFGLTTLRNRHLSIIDDYIQFQFSGKSGVEHDISIESPRLAQVLKRCQELPGHELFQYRDSKGALKPIDSGDINHYLQQVMGERFSAKDFRTWFGTVRALESLIEQEQNSPLAKAEVQSQGRETRIRIAVEEAAKQLGNRPGTCRKYYIHPLIFDAYQQEKLLPHLKSSQVPSPSLPTLEKILIQILVPGELGVDCA